MADQIPSDIIATPKGGGAIQGIGEKFSPDLFTGTGNFTVPIALPPGRNGFKPQVDLSYSTGNGNGPFGFGWNLSVPGIARKTSKGVPRYDDSRDIFVLSGAEDLVPVASPSPEVIQYRPRTEGMFAHILHHQSSRVETDLWEVRGKDGLTSWYGGVATAGDEPAIVQNQATGKAFAWRLTSTTDPFGNRIEYSYTRDPLQTDGPHQWDQIYLTEIRYADYGAPANTQFMVRVKFAYDPPFTPSSPLATRPDPFSDYRSGFEIRTIRRCKRIDIFTYPGPEVLARTYYLSYTDEIGGDVDNGASLLSRISVEGHDGANSELLPPVDLSYTQFQPQTQKFMDVTGALPASSLADGSLALVDLFGSGLPDILQMNGSARYWRNQGKGRFAAPQDIDDAPAGFGLAEAGVQILDANGDGSPDLMVTTQNLAGYFPLRFSGLWDTHSFQPYAVAPSFDLKDPQVRLVDLDGDGVTDAIRSSTSFECYFNDVRLGWVATSRTERQPLELFPNLDFADSRVKWADMTGGGLQSVVLVHDGLVEYWPALGRGNWGKRVEMPGPRLPWGYNPQRVLFGDVNGDGAADLIYVDDRQVTLWINQSGNRWSAPILIEGTPPVSDFDKVEMVDLLGNGIAGVLWSKDASALSNVSTYFLDFTGGVKPYLLNGVNNHLGATTRITYKPSTYYFLEDQQRPETKWISPLPFPVHVVAGVQTTDQFSGGTLTTEYSYHHGYWDGYEREFRGFGRVDHRDTEAFKASAGASAEHFTPPTETRIWFHQGAIGDRFSGWQESDAYSGQKSYAAEYYQEPWSGLSPTAQVLSRPSAITNFLNGLSPGRRRDALRSLRGRVLHTELYALDGTTRQDLPYTVTEHVYGVREESPPSPTQPDRLPVFFPFSLSERTTQWERGNDPLTVLTFTDNCSLSNGDIQTADYDQYGQPLSQISIAAPRGRIFQLADPMGTSYLVTQSVTTYAQRDDAQRYIVDRVSSTMTYEILNDGSSAIFDFVAQIQAGSAQRNVVSQSLNFYDGGAYQGLTFGQIGEFGALTKTESLAFTDSVLQVAYGANLPPYLSNGPPNWRGDYPQGFRDLFPPVAGYIYQPGVTGTPYVPGYYRGTDKRQYDFQETVVQSTRGLLKGKKDELGNETSVVYDIPYQLLPIKVVKPAGLTAQASYDYRLLKPNLTIDPNNNQTSYTFSPLGLLQQIMVMGQAGQNLGDTLTAPGTQITYTLMGIDSAGQSVPITDLGRPVSARTVRRVHHASETDVPEPERDQTIQTIEYSDGFGRVLQSRTQAEDVLFDPIFGDAGLPADQAQYGSDAVGQVAAANRSFVVVSGWQIYDNKGQVVEKYEPFFSASWDYAEPGETQLGQKILLYYDPRGHVIRTINPDGSEQRVVYGVPGTVASPDLTNPDVFEPLPWEAYTYDGNDNAGRTHPIPSTSYQQCWNTPSSIIIDALGRTVRRIERNRNRQSDGSWSAIVDHETTSAYDIVGNLLNMTDALGRVAFSYAYDLMKRALCSVSIDAGTRTSVIDAAGNIVEQRDSKGALILHSNDQLNRRTRMWARDTSGEPMALREKVFYGDDLAGSGLTEVQARTANLLGQPYLHYDEAGLLTSKIYDFKGNLLDKTRNVISEASLLAPFSPPPANWAINPFRVDWSSADVSSLDTSIAYQTTTSYDALNRLKTMQYPQDVNDSRKLLIPQYNRAGALENVQMEGATYVERIAYNAKGQRILVSNGNGLMTRYAYDPTTFRLIRMRTENYSLTSSGLTYHPTDPSNPLQDVGFEYDLMGNILTIHDRTPGSGIQNTLLGANALDRSFIYDPIYRLLYATGRECDVPAPPPPWDDTPRCTDITKVRPYTETYQYDSPGNVVVCNHTSGRNRYFTLAPRNNQISQVTIGSTTYQYAYNPSGCLVRENTERYFEWDQSDRMRVFRIQPDGAPPSIYAQYLYDSAGQRVMKLVRGQSGDYETTIYIDGVFELHRTVSVTGTFTVQNNSIHITDDQKLIVVIRLGTALPNDSTPAVKYEFGDHLGSSSLVVDDTGAWINREEYLPFGETSFGTFAKKRYRFSGKERDEESGLYYYGARHYSPWSFKWTSADPAGPVDGTNLYIFNADNPLNRTDSTGLGGGEPGTDLPDAGADAGTPNLGGAGNSSGSYENDPVAGVSRKPQPFAVTGMKIEPAPTPRLSWDPELGGCRDEFDIDNSIFALRRESEREELASQREIAARNGPQLYADRPPNAGDDVFLKRMEETGQFAAIREALFFALPKGIPLMMSGSSELRSLTILSDAEVAAFEAKGHNIIRVRWMDRDLNLVREFDVVSGMGDAYGRIESGALRRQLGKFFHTEVKLARAVGDHLEAGDILAITGTRTVCGGGFCQVTLDYLARGKNVNIIYQYLHPSGSVAQRVYAAGKGALKAGQY